MVPAMSTRGLFEVRRFATLGSTNSYLLEEARRGAPEGLVAVADHQTAGRGRLGRRWEAPPGTCLLLSVLLRPALDPEDLHLCTAAVALAAADAAPVVAGVSPRLKWPNDLLIGEKKVAGVLAESDPGAPGGPPGSVAVVVGIGCNVDWPGPPEAGGTSLSAAAGRPVEVDALLDALLDALAERHRLLATAVGRARLVEEWRARCDTLGQSVRVELVGGDPLEGVAVDLTPAGHLVVETAGGPVSVAAGDVVHLRPGGGPTGEK
jgi:BirA family transcriptional regulator, biotin operon repressor / biotin---[acetyl-CoA-carboxylase] ligase